MKLFAENLWTVLLDLAPWLVFGLLIAGVLHVLIPPGFLEKHLGGKSFFNVVKAAFLGVPVPLCSCGVIPAAMAIRKEGASKASCMSFLISTPQTGVDSLFVSAAMLSWPFAIFKLLSAFVIGLIGGVIYILADKGEDDDEGVEVSSYSEEKTKFSLKAIWDYGINDLLYMIWKWLLFGVILAALLSTFVNPEIFKNSAIVHGTFSLLIVLAISLPLYICATSSVPIAASLIQLGFPLSSALVFLIAGPATNVATLGAVYKSFGKKFVMIYLCTVIVGSLFCALLFQNVITVNAVSSSHVHAQFTWIHKSAAIILIILFIKFAISDIKNWLNKNKTASEQRQVIVVGLTCNGCVNKLRTALTANSLIESLDVELNTGLTRISGHDLNSLDLKKMITDAGYEMEKEVDEEQTS